MPVRITWEVFPNLDFIAQAFFQAAERTAHMEEPMREVTKFISDDLAINFAMEGRPMPWAPLAEATIKKRGSAHPILHDTGALEEAATSGDSWAISGGGQLVEANLQTPYYGKFHVTGFMGGFRHDQFVPARDWTFLDDSVSTDIDRVFSEWVLAPLEAI